MIVEKVEIERTVNGNKYLVTVNWIEIVHMEPGWHDVSSRRQEAVFNTVREAVTWVGEQIVKGGNA